MSIITIVLIFLSFDRNAVPLQTGFSSNTHTHEESELIRTKLDFPDLSNFN